MARSKWMLVWNLNKIVSHPSNVPIAEGFNKITE